MLKPICLARMLGGFTATKYRCAAFGNRNGHDVNRNLTSGIRPILSSFSIQRPALRAEGKAFATPKVFLEAVEAGVSTRRRSSREVQI